MSPHKLYTPLPAGTAHWQLQHRVVLAPLTRMRADAHTRCVTAVHVDYYAQRASPGGLLVTEAINVTRDSVAYPGVPGIWNSVQAASWRPVVDAVHAAGGVIVAQLWHTGRVASAAFGGRCVGASDVRMKRREDEPVRVLTVEELRALSGVYRRSARLALDVAGFDGVEVHAAHGYLLDQFMNDKTNVRTDEYGGSVANRCRLMLDIVDAVVAECGPQRVAVRLSPHCDGSIKYYGVSDTDPDVLYAHAIRALNARPLAYLLLTEPRYTGRRRHDKDIDTDPSHRQPLVNGPKFRHMYGGTLLGAGGFTPRSAEEAVYKGVYDGIGFGRWFISNPDLPERLRAGTPLNVYDRDTFYYMDSGKPLQTGFTDYPAAHAAAGSGHVQVEQHRIGASLSALRPKPKL